MFEVRFQLEGYSDDFVDYGSLVEMQTKMIRGMFIKDKEWSWFSKKENQVRKEDEQVYSFLNKYKN